MFYFDRDERILSGVEVPPFFHPNVTVGQVIVHNLLREPGNVVQVCYDDGVELTAGEMVKLSSRIAKNLVREEFKFGDVVGLVVKSTTYVAPLVLGCLLVGCPLSTLDPSFDVTEISNIFKQTKPKLVFCDHDNWEIVSEALRRSGNECEIVTVDENVSGVRHVLELLETSNGEPEFIPHDFGIEASKVCAVILCSSGTTGMSKAVQLSSAQCIELADVSPHLAEQTTLCFSSLYWMSGFGTMLNSLVNTFKLVITKRKFSPLLFVHLVEQYKINIVITPPYQVALLVQSPVLQLADLSSIRKCTVVGGFMPQHLREAMQDHLLYGSVVVTYGITEVGRLISSTASYQTPSESAGMLSTNTRVKIVDDDGNTLSVNEVGEIFIKTPLKFLGYANNAEATKNAFDGSWFKSGDLGCITDDGEIEVVDRKKDMIKYLNYQVAPSELEGFVQKIEGVKRVCVVGIPDIISGDLAAAVIVKEINSFLSEQDVIDEVARNFPQFKRLHGGAYFVDSLPMTPSFKVMKVPVRKLAAQMYKMQEINGNY